MKTAEEIYRNKSNIRCEGNLDMSLEDIKQIQLDAMKEGMTKAAALEPRKGFENQYDSDAEIHAHLHGWSMCSQSIIALRDNLTIEQL